MPEELGQGRPLVVTRRNMTNVAGAVPASSVIDRPPVAGCQ